MEHLAPGMVAGWKALGDPEMTPDLKRRIAEGVLGEAGTRTIAQLEAERDTMLLELLSLRAADESRQSSAETQNRCTTA
jgi:hypothetical protein